MKVRLMHPDRAFEPRSAALEGYHELERDLRLSVLLDGMAGGDGTVREVSRAALLSSGGNDLATVHHRQAVLRDALRAPRTFRALYALAEEAGARRRKEWLGVFSRSPAGIQAEAGALMRMYLVMLRRLNRLVRDAPEGLTSAAWSGLAGEARSELGEGFFTDAEHLLGELRRGGTLLLSARLGKGNAGADYAVRRPPGRRPAWLAWMLRRGPHTFHVPALDDGATRALADVRNAAVAPAAYRLAQAADGVRAFFEALRTELAFYVGCLNLNERLRAAEAGVCVPEVQAGEAGALGFSGLVDASLALQAGRGVVGNSLDLDGKRLIVVTGANGGGKTVFLRSLGLAQLLAQSGSLVAADAFRGHIVPGVATHFRREEDAALERGKLDEELGRLSGIVDRLRPGALALFNESFAATNEREGSEVARQVVDALTQRGTTVAYVTHLYAFARQAYEQGSPEAIFLRAERRADGARTFRILEAPPLETGHARDLYRSILVDGRQA